MTMEMERRQFLKLTSAGGLAVAGGGYGRSILDFAPSNGADDDGPGLRDALVWSEANSQPVNLLDRKLLLRTAPGIVSTTRHHGAERPWGLVGNGATIYSQYDDRTKAAIDLRGGTRVQSRNLWLTGINFKGRGAKGDGTAYNGPAIQIAARLPGERFDGNFYNCMISHIRVEGHDYGIRMPGYVFEVPISHVEVMDCVTDGFAFELGGTNMGSVFLSQFIASRCGRHGVLSDGVRVLGITQGYIRNCGREGLKATNGLAHPVTNVAFENNWQSAPYHDKQAHIRAINSARFYGCFATGDHPTNGARFLLRKAPFDADWTLLDCSVSGMAGRVPIGLLRAEGPGTVTKLNCRGADQVIAPAAVRTL